MAMSKLCCKKLLVLRNIQTQKTEEKKQKVKAKSPPGRLCLSSCWKNGQHGQRLSLHLLFSLLSSSNHGIYTLSLSLSKICAEDRIDPFVFKFQFKNVEYSSGRNKTILCYLVDKGNTADGLLRGYLEDEHAGTHVEEAFFTQCFPHEDPALKYTVTWYVSSSPCSTCTTKIAKVLKDQKNIKLSIFAARLFEWEEGEIQAGLKALHAAGCKLRVMKPLDFSYTWDTFVENEDQPLNLWEDCKENYEYYHEKLSDILQ
uniref:Apolipoprotein B mRNA editing enzyme, catalytic polypeptide-like 2a n=1 Tax=Amphilophus citrinellus TaxID=61819 RepID=A0A3Q0SDQ9_AMPCI